MLYHHCPGLDQARMSLDFNRAGLSQQSNDSAAALEIVHSHQQRRTDPDLASGPSSLAGGGGGGSHHSGNNHGANNNNKRSRDTPTEDLLTDDDLDEFDDDDEARGSDDDDDDLADERTEELFRRLRLEEEAEMDPEPDVVANKGGRVGVLSAAGSGTGSGTGRGSKTGGGEVDLFGGRSQAGSPSGPHHHLQRSLVTDETHWALVNLGSSSLYSHQ